MHPAFAVGAQRIASAGLLPAMPAAPSSTVSVASPLKRGSARDKSLPPLRATQASYREMRVYPETMCTHPARTN
jgi:hypothetical protein